MDAPPRGNREESRELFSTRFSLSSMENEHRLTRHGTAELVSQYRFFFLFNSNPHSNQNVPKIFRVLASPTLYPRIFRVHTVGTEETSSSLGLGIEPRTIFFVASVVSADY